MKFLLGPADRARYGLGDEPLDVDLAELYQDEAEELDEHGIDPDQWVTWLNSGDVRVWRVVVWLGLARNGVEVKLAEVRFNRRAVRYTPAESSGKDGTDPASETNESPTPPRSSDGSPD